MSAPPNPCNVRGGLGGAVPARAPRKEEGEGNSLTPPQASIADTLAACGVFVLAPDRRRAVADALTAAGISATDIADLADFVSNAESDEALARKYLAATVSDPERTREAVAGLGQYRKSRKAKQATTRRGPAPTQPWADLETVGDDQRAEWERDRTARIAYCRAVADRRTHTEVATELGVHVDALPALIDRGRALSQGDTVKPKKAIDEGETQEQRRVRFVEMMREKGATR